MIDINLVPPSVQEMVSEAEHFTADNWREITSSWNPFYHEAARIFRKLGEAARSEAILQSGDSMEELIESMGGVESDGGAIIFSIYCLSDTQLDVLISTFPQ